MPIYDYQCKACGHQLEAIQRMSDAPLSDCPACGKPELAKQISAPSFRLKGTGWYETDFKTGNRKHGTQDAKTAGSNTSGSNSSAKPGGSNAAAS
ncbi:FmdB family transcriptional regulator [Pseudohongiella nitratireducens]|jgi:putative FmdB family regulatory protein|uniref:FmdB family transcriptional regulator n=1 Tax=Pseudohongiella nitratireducens TaxID=1768907 RepID=A0A917GUP3_9GAMM|nr:zinc ribbon domain-containing protein [Pseudohongiella nitratireducens]MDF1623729.1 zinc ribbon domain-containing protein [Pseudohongiella nitratireducens]GGG57129.1 FmdB family transcriptional regulator [Pseudohongiella nitratireducens]|tara:strand:- start:2792 stop:3076 length:285 start_codon:yes stop_codon:yes gene_type:complete